ncbi:MFS transporter [Thiotrichales bacterium 19S3-7]|nr:MFS transporter [Thiotrichales bacterium 19S3-7]MCF6803119.1 MFS transporter [Thiotrichales bacterium 19S3-11]
MVSLGFFMVVMDVTIVNVALPSIKMALSTSITGLEWVVDGYTLTFAAFLLLAGSLGGACNTKRIFQLGLVIFSLTSLGCGLSNSIYSLTILRVFQGVGAAFILPNSLNLINRLASDEAERTKLIGIWAAIGGLAAAIGPIIGGILTELISWRSVFLVNVPLGIICLIFIEKTIPEVYSQSKRINIDLSGQILAIFAIASLAFALIGVSDYGWLSTRSLIYSSIFILLLSAFIYSQHKVSFPMFPIQLFKSKHFSIAMVIGLIMNITFYGELFILPLYFHQIMGLSIANTGFALMPLMLVTGISSYFSSKLIHSMSAELLIINGFLIGILGFMSLFIAIFFQATYVVFILPLTMIGFSISFIMPAATITTLASVTDSYHGLASGAFNMARQVGSLMGVALFGSVLASMMNFSLGVEVTIIISCALFLVGLISSFYLRLN